MKTTKKYRFRNRQAMEKMIHQHLKNFIAQQVRIGLYPPPDRKITVVNLPKLIAYYQNVHGIPLKKMKTVYRANAGLINILYDHFYLGRRSIFSSVFQAKGLCDKLVSPSPSGGYSFTEAREALKKDGWISWEQKGQHINYTPGYLTIRYLDRELGIENQNLGARVSSLGGQGYKLLHGVEENVVAIDIMRGQAETIASLTEELKRLSGKEKGTECTEEKHTEN